MAWSGSLGSRTFARLTGLFTGSTAWAQTRAASRGIEDTDHDTHDQDLADGINACLTKDGGNKATADIDWGGFKITTLGAPSAGGDAANKTYVDSQVTAAVNFTCRVATTGNVNLTTDVDDGSTVDGVAVATGDLILIKSNSAQAENGVYVVPAAAGTAARSTTFDTWAEHVNSIIYVTAGTVNAGLSFRCNVNTGGTLNTTAITYVQHGSTLTLPIGLASGGTGQITAALSFAALKQDATASATGVVELATAAELRTGTDTARVAPVSIMYDALAEVALSDGASIALDMATGINFNVTLAGNRTLANPTNVISGRTGRIRVVQDGTGSRTLAYGTSYEFANGTAPTLSTTAADEDVIYYDAISSTRILCTIVKDIS